MNILFLSYWFPAPPDNGSRIRCFNLLQALCQKHRVTLLSFYDAADFNDVQTISAMCNIAALVPRLRFNPRNPRTLIGLLDIAPRYLTATHSKVMESAIQNELRQNSFDLAVASELGAASHLSHRCPVPSIFDDVEVSLFSGLSLGAPTAPARVRHMMSWQKMRLYLRRLLGRFSACTVVSEIEKRNVIALGSHCPKIAIVPNGVSIDPAQHLDKTRCEPVLIFNGALTYAANYDAMSYFLADVWPLIKSQVPDAVLKITGKTDGVRLDRLKLGKDTILTGYLDDIKTAVATAKVCVAPLRIGGGTRLKILEAMALGTPVVATSKGAEGLSVVDDESIQIADDPSAFAARTVQLLTDVNLHRRIAQAGRQLVESRYSWALIGQQFVQLAESLV